MSSSFGGSGGAGAAWGALSQKCGDADGTPKGSLSPEGPYLTLTSCQREIKTIIKTHHADGRQRQHKEQRGAQSPENAPQHCRSASSPPGKQPPRLGVTGGKFPWSVGDGGTYLGVLPLGPLSAPGGRGQQKALGRPLSFPKGKAPLFYRR